jgi:hypothetical protein
MLEYDDEGRYGSKEPWVCEFFLPWPRALSGVRVAELGLSAEGRSVRNGVGVGLEKLGRLVVLEFARAGDTYSARGDGVAVLAVCC